MNGAIRAPRVFRDYDRPEGLPSLCRDDAVTLCRPVQWPKNQSKGCWKLHAGRGRFASFEHPMIRSLGACPKRTASAEMIGNGRAFPCAASEESTKSGSLSFTTPLHSTPSFTSQCARAGPLASRVTSKPCLVLMEAVHDELSRVFTEPFGAKQLFLQTLMQHQLYRATFDGPR